MLEVKEKIFEHDQMWDAIHEHLGLKKHTVPEQQKLGKGAQGMVSSLTSGLKFGGIGSKSSSLTKSKQIKGIDIGALVEKDENDEVHNIDPMKILGKILKAGLQRRREQREMGIEDAGGIFGISSNPQMPEDKID